MCLAVPGEIVEILSGDPLMRQAKVNFGGVVKTISLGFLPEARPGEFVLVHAGVAISVVDEEEAKRRFLNTSRRSTNSISPVNQRHEVHG